MLNKKHITWTYVISILFIIANLFFIAKGNFYLNLLPLGLIIILLSALSVQNLFLLIVILTPLSVPLRIFLPTIAYDFYIPTEPLLFGLMILFAFKSLQEKTLSKKFLMHPVSLAIYFYLVWIFITSITSSIPLVSFKFLLAKLWFIIGFYFFAGYFFKNIANIKKYLYAYIIPLFLVIIYVLIRHSQYGFFDQRAAHSVVNPFFNDHTSYGAVLAMIFPIIIGLYVNSGKTIFKRINHLIIFIFTIAIVFSYTRATWLSLIGAFGLWSIIKLRIKFKTLFFIGGIVAFLFFSFQTDIIIKLKGNKEESSGNLTKHVRSMSNITTDVSNLERLNRWNCAIKMFKEKPVFGFGPGTYTFKYAPYQLSNNRTPISTNFGDWGNAHSEYLGPLSESGFLGMISIVLIIIFSIITGLRAYSRSTEKEIKIISLSILIGLFTYFIHGVLNNFLDTDKMSALFWGFIAILVALDVNTEKEIN